MYVYYSIVQLLADSLVQSLTCRTCHVAARFPVKKVFVSRFDGGLVMEADFAQLSFGLLPTLSQDEVAIEEVSTGFDVHAYTAKVITDAGQPTNRQDAKAHTFAPLYGATGYGRTKSGSRILHPLQQVPRSCRLAFPTG